MLENLKKSIQPGTFEISAGREIRGELSLAGKNTSLYLHDREHFDVTTTDEQCLKGILHDLTKVTLIECITRSKGEIFKGSEQDCVYNSRIFPHYIVFGNHHIAPEEKTISSVHFVVDDASTIFYDFDAFGSLIDARPFINQIVHANQSSREVQIGPYPLIQYYTGKREIFVSDTVIGKISASHSPAHSMGGAEGVSIQNTVILSIEFNEAVTFAECIDNIMILQRYLAIQAGRAQRLLKIEIRINSEEEWPRLLEVYWCMPVGRGSSDDTRKPQSRDILIDGVEKPDEFALILANWIRREISWHAARCRFFNSFTLNHYSIDRLIGAANMFDILPDSAIPPAVPLSEEQEHIRNSCTGLFKTLPQSNERDSVLSALGRMGTNSLRSKIRYRGQIIINAVKDRFNNLFMVTDEAVKCRNHYVHGSPASFDYDNKSARVDFLIDSLEFVFAASDLIEAGWNINEWISTPTTMTHPFGRYRYNYEKELKKLQTLLVKGI